VLLRDFGLSVPVGAPHLGQSAGYAPPERLAGATAAAADDVYALGRVLSEVLEAGGAPNPAVPNPTAWQQLAALLTSPERPRDAASVVTLLPPPAASG
jgi:serine/threonine protein kinase